MRFYVSSLVLLGLAACTDSNTDQSPDPGGCEPGAIFECVCSTTLEGTQVCGDDRTFGACVCGDGQVESDTGSPDSDVEPECAAGGRQIGPCGMGGERSRSCEDDRWGEWSACAEPCEDGVAELRVCGQNERGESRRVCEGGEWSAWFECADPDECTDDDSDAEACGANDSGERERLCEMGQWSAFGPCEGIDACVPGAEQARACGLNDNGRQARACVDGQWGEYGQCEDPDECMDGQQGSEVCGLQDNGMRLRDCVAGRWTPFGACDDPDRQCEGGAVESVLCGLNGRGRREHTCVDERWGPFGDCEDPDVCVDDAVEVEACGLNDNGSRERGCQGGQWREWSACDDPDMCRDGAEMTQECEDGGEQSRACLAGQWSDFGECVGGGACVAGAQQARICPNGGQETRACVDRNWGPWSECADRAIRSVLMLCGNSDREVEEFIRGRLVGQIDSVVSDCEPDDTVQAVLMTRDGIDGLSENADEVRAWVAAGGILINEFGSSHALNTLMFAETLVKGVRVGDCSEEIMPDVQFTAGDPIWDAVPFDAPNSSGCGFDISDFNDIIALGGWSDPGTVSLAYRPYGLGRVWFVESDWQDEGVVGAPSLELMAEMIATAPRAWPACSDGLDNDEDGRRDSLDPGCISREDDSEADPGPCGPNEVRCGGACTDLEDDDRNCGGCGLICTGTCQEGGCDEGLVWSGIRQDVPAAQTAGWTQCFAQEYDVRNTSVAGALEDCGGRRIMLGCRPIANGNVPWTLLAMGLRETILTAPGGRGTDTTLSHNGVGWYFSDNASIGFAPEGDPVNLVTCDLEARDDPLRMCWHTEDGLFDPGWRCGLETGTIDYVRAMWTRD